MSIKGTRRAQIKRNVDKALLERLQKLGRNLAGQPSDDKLVDECVRAIVEMAETEPSRRIMPTFVYQLDIARVTEAAKYPEGSSIDTSPWVMNEARHLREAGAMVSNSKIDAAAAALERLALAQPAQPVPPRKPATPEPAARASAPKPGAHKR